MAGPFKKVTSANPGIDHTDAAYTKMVWVNGAAAQSSSGHPSPFTGVTLKAIPTVTSEKLVVPVGGNASDRIYGNTVIDDRFNLYNLLSAPKHKCKFVALKIVRRVTATAVTAAERIFQIGDQGSSAADQFGGWVGRINFGASGLFLTKSVSMAIHVPYIGETKTGGQGTANHEDAIPITAVLSDAAWNAGICFMFAVDASVAIPTARIYVDGVLSVSTAIGGVQADTRYTLPRADNYESPVNDAASGGLTFFAQSTNQGAAPLKDSDVWPMWIGEARDTAHLLELAGLLYANPLANPYARA